LKRLVSAVRFRLSGSGWYETDFKSEQETKRNLHEELADRTKRR
jgi:predicted nucleic acid-binding Zn ribbon protein